MMMATNCAEQLLTDADYTIASHHTPITWCYCMFSVSYRRAQDEIKLLGSRHPDFIKVVHLWQKLISASIYIYKILHTDVITLVVNITLQSNCCKYKVSCGFSIVVWESKFLIRTSLLLKCFLSTQRYCNSILK